MANQLFDIVREDGIVQPAMRSDVAPRRVSFTDLQIRALAAVVSRYTVRHCHHATEMLSVSLSIANVDTLIECNVDAVKVLGWWRKKIGLMLGLGYAINVSGARSASDQPFMSVIALPVGMIMELCRVENEHRRYRCAHRLLNHQQAWKPIAATA